MVAGAALVLGLIGLGYKCASDRASFAGVKAEVKQYRKAAEATERSVAISAETQTRVQVEQADTGRRTAKAVENINAVIQTRPAVAGPADADVLRESREAYRRAVAAHCRVQRTSDCADAAPSTEQ